jgi:hypothetical protein
MKRALRFAPSPALVVAMVAVFVALTGTAVATTSALITGAQIKNGSITGADVKNKSLTARDFKGSIRGPRGLRGASGPAGPTGATGASGPAGAPNPNAANSELLDGLDSSNFVRKTGVYTIPGVEFHARSTGTTAACSPETVSASAGAVLYAGVHLPDGVTVTRLTNHYWDFDATDTAVELRRIPNPATSSAQVMASAPSAGNSGNHTSSEDTTIETPAIDNDAFQYYVRATLPGGGAQCVDAVEIAYTG